MQPATPKRAPSVDRHQSPVPDKIPDPEAAAEQAAYLPAAKPTGLVGVNFPVTIFRKFFYLLITISLKSPKFLILLLLDRFIHRHA